jgi:hypothetical protein
MQPMKKSPCFPQGLHVDVMLFAVLVEGNFLELSLGFRWQIELERAAELATVLRAGALGARGGTGVSLKTGFARDRAIELGRGSCEGAGNSRRRNQEMAADH